MHQVGTVAARVTSIVIFYFALLQALIGYMSVQNMRATYASGIDGPDLKPFSLSVYIPFVVVTAILLPIAVLLWKRADKFCPSEDGDNANFDGSLLARGIVVASGVWLAAYTLSVLSSNLRLRGFSFDRLSTHDVIHYSIHFVFACIGTFLIVRPDFLLRVNKRAS